MKHNNYGKSIKDYLVTTNAQKVGDYCKNFSFPYQEEVFTNFMDKLTKGSVRSYRTYLGYLINNNKFPNIVDSKFLSSNGNGPSFREIVLLLPNIFKGDKNLGKMTIELLCQKLREGKDNPDEKIVKAIDKSRSALRKYGLFLGDFVNSNSVPNVNKEVSSMLYSATRETPYSLDYDTLFQKLYNSMCTQDRLKPAENGICYPIRLIKRILGKDDFDKKMKPCVDNIIIYHSFGSCLVKDMKNRELSLELKKGAVTLRSKNSEQFIDVYDKQNRKLTAYVPSDISIEHERSIAKELRNNPTINYPTLSKLSELINSTGIIVTPSNRDKIYSKIEKEKSNDVQLLDKKKLQRELETILGKIPLSLMNTTQNSKDNEHD